MRSDKKFPWIEAGYEAVARDGFTGLNIESLARDLNRNKSSFYYYFGDLEVFEQELLKLHLDRAALAAEQLKQCEKVFPDMVNIAIERKTDLFFHKQLRIHRHNPRRKRGFEQAFQVFEESFLDIWADSLGLNKQKLFARSFLHLIVDNFLLRITYDTFTYDWGVKYLVEVANMLQRINPPHDS